jgi:hypothetical protein
VTLVNIGGLSKLKHLVVETFPSLDIKQIQELKNGVSLGI